MPIYAHDLKYLSDMASIATSNLRASKQKVS